MSPAEYVGRRLLYPDQRIAVSRDMPLVPLDIGCLIPAKKPAIVYSPAMRKILALLVLPPLIVAVFVYHAKMMTLLVRFQPDQVQIRTAAR